MSLVAKSLSFKTLKVKLPDDGLYVSEIKSSPETVLT